MIKTRRNKIIALFLALSFVVLSTPITAKDKKLEFSLAPKKMNVQQTNWESFSIKKDSIFSLSEQRLLAELSVYQEYNLNTYSRRGSNFFKGAWIGALMGGFFLGVIGSQSKSEGAQLSLLGVKAGIIIGGIVGELIAVLGAED